MFLTNLPRLGQAFLLTTIVAMVESQHGPMDQGYGSGMEECCREKMVGSVSYTLLDDPFRGQIPHQCLNDCVYTVSGTSRPKFCFERGDLPTQCLSADPEVTVTGGYGPNEGNIMIGGRPVCDDLWSQEDAVVVCRQLGYSNGVPTENSLFGQVSTDFIYDDVQCHGNEEHIWDCPHSPSHNCGSGEGAGVICFNDVGLVGGSGPNEGNVLVNGQSVCDDLWSQEDAMVVCRQLGYSYGEPTSNSHFGSVSTDFIYDDVQCHGDEEYISNCPHEPNHNCGSSEGAGVICSMIELAGGSGPHEGNLMIQGQPVCDDLWSQENALVVCRQLGYLYGEATSESAFGPVSDNFAMDNVQCNGTEEYIWRCPHYTDHNCGGDEGAGVICSNDQGYGLGPTTTESAPVNVAVLVKDASSNDVVADVSVEFTLGDLVLTETTNYEGVVVFTLGSEVALDRTATIVISREGYISVTIERMIRYGFQNEIFQVFASPALAEGEHRLVLSWATSTDLDAYALQMDKTTGEIVCKTWYGSRGGCAGVNLDVDVSGYGPETITWTNADNDNYIYQLYVHDYSQGGVAGTGASITLYGETSVEMSVADGDGGDLWWMLGTFEPSVGTSSFLTIDTLQNFDPDSRASRNEIPPTKGPDGKLR